MNKIFQNHSDKSYIKHLESELMAQRQTAEMYRQKLVAIEEENARRKKAEDNDAQLLAKVNSHLLNYENDVFGSETTLERIQVSLKWGNELL